MLPVLLRAWSWTVSTRVMDACWGLQLPPTEKAVLMSLADQSNDAGVCWPSVASLVERTCLGERTVQRALRALEAQALVVCAVGAMKSNRYTLAVGRLRAMEREREAAKDAARQAARGAGDVAVDGVDLVTTPATVAPRQCGTPASVAPHPRHSGTQTVIEPIHTPHTPQPSAGGLADPLKLDSRQPGRGQGEKPMLGMAAWLEQVRALGEDAIPEADPVFTYAERVGLGRELVALAWREFKRRQLASRKRHNDCRRAFRNCVEGNWYGLWWMRPGDAAELSSKGEQARRFFEAEDAAAQAGQEGGNA